MVKRLIYKPVKFNRCPVVVDRKYPIDMMRIYFRLLRRLSSLWSHWFRVSYRPEEHYMRGPGRKDPAKDGRENSGK